MEKVYICLYDNYYGEGSTPAEAFDTMSSVYEANEYEAAVAEECTFYEAYEIKVEQTTVFTIVE